MRLNGLVGRTCLVAGCGAILASLLAPYLGLGVKEDFLLFKLAGIARTPLAAAGFIAIFVGLVLGARPWLAARFRLKGLLLAMLVAGTVATIIGLFAPALGLGTDREFLLYQMIGMKRGPLAILGLLAISAYLAVWFKSRRPDRKWIGWLRAHRRELGTWAVNGAMAIVSLCLTIGVIEVALRAAYLRDSWSHRNFAAEAVDQIVTNVAIVADPVLGYIGKPNFHVASGASESHHGDYGIRLNKHRETPADNLIRPGGILAVGDSFAFGSEVKDDESWPAYLEGITGVPVVNGGVGGYGIDMAYLRAEQLLPHAKPKAIIMGCIPNCIQRNELSLNAGLPKPHYRIENGDLVFYPPQPYQPAAKHIGRLRKVFGHLYSIYWAMDRLDLLKYWTITSHEYQYTKQDGAEISCRLMEKFASLARRNGAKAVLLMEYSGYQVLGEDKGREFWRVPYVFDCARRHDVTVVDSYPPLLQQYKVDPDGFWNNWVKQPNDKRGHSGHMSAKGNRLIAELLAPAVQNAIGAPNGTAAAASTRIPR